MYCTAYARGQLGRTPPAADDPWRAGHGTRLLFFVGFDNLFIWALVHVAELIAHQGRYVLPETILTNEFYDLEHEKFSTSMGHVVWARELVAEVPRDIVRFYLTLTAPEHARTNFSRAALDKVAGQRLVGPWNELAAALAKLTAEVGDATLPTSVPGRELAAAMTARFRHCYDLDSFSLSRAADLVVQHVDRLRVAAGRLLGAAGDRDGLPAGLGDLFLQLRALIGCASPILVDLAGRAALAGDVTPSLAAGTAWPAGTTAFAVPALDLRTAPAGDPAPAPGPTRTV